jgi:hypothetical protein
MVLEIVAKFIPFGEGGFSGFRTFRERVPVGSSFDELVAIALGFLYEVSEIYKTFVGLESFRVI